jgi:hypothetical protein
MNPGPWQCVLSLIPRSFHDGGAINYSTAPPSWKDNTNFQRLSFVYWNQKYWALAKPYFIALNEPKFHRLFILRSLFLHCCCCSYWYFERLFVNIGFSWVPKSWFWTKFSIISSKLVVCQNCLNLLDVNKQSLIPGHCSIVTVAIWCYRY